MLVKVAQQITALLMALSLVPMCFCGEALASLDADTAPDSCCSSEPAQEQSQSETDCPCCNSHNTIEQYVAAEESTAPAKPLIAASQFNLIEILTTCEHSQLNMEMDRAPPGLSSLYEQKQLILC